MHKIDQIKEMKEIYQPNKFFGNIHKRQYDMIGQHFDIAQENSYQSINTRDSEIIFKNRKILLPKKPNDCGNGSDIFDIYITNPEYISTYLDSLFKLIIKLTNLVPDLFSIISDYLFLAELPLPYVKIGRSLSCKKYFQDEKIFLEGKKCIFLKNEVIFKHPNKIRSYKLLSNGIFPIEPSKFIEILIHFLVNTNNHKTSFDMINDYINNVYATAVNKYIFYAANVTTLLNDISKPNFLDSHTVVFDGSDHKILDFLLGSESKDRLLALIKQYAKNGDIICYYKSLLYLIAWSDFLPYVKNFMDTVKISEYIYSYMKD